MNVQGPNGDELRCRLEWHIAIIQRCSFHLQEETINEDYWIRVREIYEGILPLAVRLTLEYGSKDGLPRGNDIIWHKDGLLFDWMFCREGLTGLSHRIQYLDRHSWYLRPLPSARSRIKAPKRTGSSAQHLRIFADIVEHQWFEVSQESMLYSQSQSIEQFLEQQRVKGTPAASFVSLVDIVGKASRDMRLLLPESSMKSLVSWTSQMLDLASDTSKWSAVQTHLVAKLVLFEQESDSHSSPGHCSSRVMDLQAHIWYMFRDYVVVGKRRGSRYPDVDPLKGYPQYTREDILLLVSTMKMLDTEGMGEYKYYERFMKSCFPIDIYRRQCPLYVFKAMCDAEHRLLRKEVIGQSPVRLTIRERNIPLIIYLLTRKFSSLLNAKTNGIDDG